MITTDLSRRIERLERQIQPRSKSMKGSDKTQSLATTNLLRRLNEARRRIAQEGDERYAAYKDLPPEPLVHAPSHPNEIVMILNAARKRMNEENELARQTAGTAAAMKENEITEPLTSERFGAACSSPLAGQSRVGSSPRGP
jgi:hypothetical protein